jgi:hypothetical protein
MQRTQSIIAAVALVLSGGSILAQNGAPADQISIAEKKELFITDSAVLTACASKKDGPWHIRGALRRIAGKKPDGTPVDVDQFASAWFNTWAENQEVAGVPDTFQKRPWVAQALKDAWAADRIRLIAIVNRMDLARFPNNDPTQPPISLGEGRFIYEVMASATNPEPFTIIFEYRLPGELTSATLRGWARDWHHLGSFAAFNDDYRSHLQEITNRFSAHGTLNQIRTNEFLDVPAGQARLWEMREFHFDSSTTSLKQVTTKLTPAIELTGDARLKEFVRANADAFINGGSPTLPSELASAVAPVPAPSFKWTLFDDNQANELRRAGFIFSFNTCNGCHAGDTGTPFQHIGARAPSRSDFLNREITLAHPLPGQNSTAHNEMQIRADMLRDFLRDVSGFDNPKLKANVRARAKRVH